MDWTAMDVYLCAIGCAGGGQLRAFVVLAASVKGSPHAPHSKRPGG